MKKWITGALGWALGGPIGGVIGFLIGSAFEQGGDKIGNSSQRGGATQRNSFLISLLVMSAAIMKADGKIMKSELDYVKDFIRRNFGAEAEGEALTILKGLLEKEINIQEVATQIRVNMNASQKLQLLHYLTGIALSDGQVVSQELEALKSAAFYMGIPKQDSDSIFAMFDKGIDSAYQVLEIEKSATDDEVKKAYKKMALKHHPDKVSALGADVQRAAEEKFKKISEAYDKIKKDRGII